LERRPVAADEAQRDAAKRLDAEGEVLEEKFVEPLQQVREADLAVMFEAARFAVDFQAQASERLQAKVARLAASVSAFAAAVQAFALRDVVLRAEDHDMVVVAAFVAGGLLVVALVLCAWALFPTRDGEIIPEVHLRPRLKGLVSHPEDRRTVVLVINDHLNLGTRMRKANRVRGNRLLRAQLASLPAIMALGVELTLALIVIS